MPGVARIPARSPSPSERRRSLLCTGLPAHATPTLSPAGNAPRHAGNARRISLKITPGGRDRIQARPKYARQTHLVDPAIVMRQRRVLRHDRHTGHAGQQRDQRLLAREHRMPPACRDQRQITGELNRVAETLLGVHQHGQPGGVAAIPLRSGQIDEVAPEPVMALPPFVFPKAKLEVPGQQCRHRLVPVGLGEIRTQRDGRLAGANRLIEAVRTRSV